MKPLPEEFEQSMRQQLEGHFPDFAAALQQSPPVSLRMHSVKNQHSFDGKPVPWTKYGLYLDKRPVFTLDPLFHAGTYYVQEASSMFLEQALKQSVDLTQPLTVLDLCAAPGGKSTHILSLLSRDSLLVSNETIRSRANILSENVQKWGYPNSIVTNNDPAHFKKFHGCFDVIVTDAPCSGEGLFRKEPDAMKEWSPENVQLCAARQKRIIADVWDALRQDGIFIYCTCTYNYRENEENLKWLQDKTDVEFIKLSLDPSWGVEEVKSGSIFAYRFYPHKTRGEGFFISIVKKREPTESLRLKPRKALDTPSRQARETLASWIIPDRDSTFFQFNDLIFYAPSAKAREIEFLLQSLKVVYGGTNVAIVKRDKLVPEHSMALSVELNKNSLPSISVTSEDALRYLRRESLHPSDAPVGFTLLTFQDVPLGWVNVLANRVNNMYPSDWKIRM